MLDKITAEDLIEEVYQDQLDHIKESDLSPKEKAEKREMVKDSILECENMEELKTSLKKLGYREVETLEYFLSFFIEE